MGFFLVAFAAFWVGVIVGIWVLRGRAGARARHLASGLQETEQTAERLRTRQAQLQGMIEELSAGVTRHGPSGEILEANAAALTLLGTTQRRLLGRDSIDLEGDALGEEGAPLGPGGDPVRRVVATRHPMRDVVMGLRKAGSADRTWMQVSAEPVFGSDGTLSEVVCTFQDITERRRAHEQIRHLAYHDPLTQLPNRELFVDRLSVALAQGQRQGRGVAVLFVDLDDFKVVNDALGHTVGDAVMRTLAQRLKSAVREADTVARFGGDEFVVLLTGGQAAADLARIADKLHEAVRRPVHVEGRDLVVSASIGATVFPEDGRDVEALIRNADVAMYRAKEVGRGRTEFYTSAMGARVRDQLEADARLRLAVTSGELELHYQPVVSLADGRVDGYEALVRWRDPQRGLVPPNDFIPAAEAAMGAIHEVGAWVLQTACRDLARLPAGPGSRPRVAVNLSARQFHTGDIVEQVRSALEAATASPSMLELEITESVALHGHDSTEQALRRLKELGLSIAIDDFGTGYSSLSYLRRFPIDTLKVDRSFVRDAAANPDASAITRAIVGVGHQLGLRVVAEGVETREQLRLLRLMGCDAAQGFFFCRAVPLTELPGQQLRIAELWAREFPPS